MARAALAPIINELRRKVYDFLADSFDASVYLIGDTIRLVHQFKNMSSVAATVANAEVNVKSPGGVVMATNVAMAVGTGSGARFYDFQSSQSMSQGVFRAEFVGSVGSIQRRGLLEFEIGGSQRIWTDDELETYLDKHRIFIGVEKREKLSNNAARTRYFSAFDTFEWANLYTTADTAGTQVSGSTDNLIVGEFVFSTGQSQDLFLEGHAFNIYAAAAECLEELAGDPNRTTSWTRGSVSQEHESPLDLATYYRRIAHGGRQILLERIYH